MMKHTLGRTGYEVSALGLGGFQFTSMFDVKTSEADEIVDYAISNGINFIDTAPVYGRGESEAIIGRALQRHTGTDRPYVMAKFGHLQDGILAGCKDPIACYQDPEKIIASIKQSMWILRIDHFDILLMHEVEREWKADFDTGNCVGMDVLEQMKKEGIAANIGGASWDCNALARMLRTDRLDVVMVAGGISLLNRWMYDELIPAAQEHHAGVVVGGCLGQNNRFLVMQDREGVKKELLGSDDPRKREQGEKLLKLYDLADEQELTMIQMAVRYVLAHEEIHSHTMGARALAHIQDNIRSAEMGPLPADIVAKIDAIQDIDKNKSDGMHLKEFTTVSNG